MITLIVSILCFIGLVVLGFVIGVKNNKTFMMAGIVMLMLLLTIVDELIIPKYPLTKVQAPEHFQYKPLENHLKLNISTQLYKNTPARTLLKQQRMLLTYLLQKQAAKQNMVLHIKNIDTSRFRAIFKEFQQQTQVPAVHVDFHQHQYSYGDLENVLSKGNHGSGIVYLFVDGFGEYSNFNVLENIFLMYNVSYILESLPMNMFELTTLSKWTHQYEFEGNYITQVLENHPPRLVEICNKYRTIDYSFYVMSQSQPLSQLCTKLPTNQVTECIRNKLQKVQDRVPFSKVRKCFDGHSKNVDGVIYENGMIGLKKDYYYAGRVDKSVFMVDQIKQPDENL